ncbi:MAG TPA: NAD-dependent epimerase/dehydratase family protein [Vicinamibacterales bacterium]|nr:NAD-dependent epimerase/dehydratase family protein [Vicinamibacterales bacterium]
MRVLVTGGTGYLGQAIVRALIERGHTPVVFTRAKRTSGQEMTSGVFFGGTGSKKTPDVVSGPDVVFVTGDVRDRDALVAAARGCDAMIHSAALVSIWRPRPHDFDEVNVGGLRHALDAVRTHGLRRLVYTSSFLALPPAGCKAPLVSNDYQRTKAAARLVADQARSDGRPIVSMYPGVIYGPGILSEGNLIGRMISDHIAGRLPGLLGADRLWSFAWVDEVAAAHVSALEHKAPQAEYQVGGPNLPQMRPFEELHRLKGITLPRRLPLWAGTPAAWLDETRARLTGRPPQLTRATLDIFRHDWTLDSSNAERDLDYRQKDLAAGITEMLEIRK